MREMREEDVYQELDNRTKAKFEAFDDHCRKCLSGLEKLSEKSNVLADIQKYANESELSAILQAVKFYKVPLFYNFYRMYIQSLLIYWLDIIN